LSTAGPSTIRYGTIRYGPIRYGTGRYGREAGRWHEAAAAPAA